jgi:formate dehydrogenase major subunit
MDVTRRDFLKISGAATAGLMLGSLFDLAPIKAYAVKNPPQWDQVTTSICCYCGVGCGILVGTSTTDPDTVYVQGDPDHPINRGSLCSKGQGMGQLRTVDGALNPRRLTGIKYRQPNAADWDQDGFGNDKLYAWNETIPSIGKTALDAIADRIKTMRDGPNPGWSGGILDPNSPQYNTTLEEEIEDPDNPGTTIWVPTNRCTGIACLGGAAHDTEECYLLVKLMRALGLVYIEHQARI